MLSDFPEPMPFSGVGVGSDANSADPSPLAMFPTVYLLHNKHRGFIEL